MRTKLFIVAGAAVCQHCARQRRRARPSRVRRGVRRQASRQPAGQRHRVEWINPHAWIHVDHKKPDGTVESWMVEGGTPNTLLRRGITKDSLKIGTEIVVRGYQSKDALCKPKCRANGRDVTFPDGRKLFMGSSGTGAPTDGADEAEKPQ